MSRPKKIKDALPALAHIVGRFWPRIRRQRLIMTGSFFAMFAGIVMQLLEPWPLKFVFDRVIPIDTPKAPTRFPLIESLDPMTVLTLSAIAIVVFALLRAVAEYFNKVGFSLLGNRVLTEVRNDLYTHLQTLSLSFHSKARDGDLVVRIIGDVNMLKEVVVTAFLPLVANVLILTGMVVVMFLVQWRLALVAMIIIPLFGLSTVRLSRRIHEVARKQRQRQGAMAATAAESIGAIKLVQALSLGKILSGQFASRSKQDLKQGVKGARLTARLERTVDVLVAIGTALVLWYGARLVLRGELTPGDLLVFLTYLKRAFRPARDFAKFTGRLAKAAAAGERVIELLDQVPTVQERPDAVPAPPFRGAIRFRDVAFCYETGHPILEGMDFEVEPGELVVVAGPSGIGKSTVISLLLRLYDPGAGEVLIDGQDITRFTLDSLRSRMSVVLQENLLFAADVWQNIAYGAPGVSRDEILAAAELANAHRFVQALPQGYDTVLGERGVTLSHGQRQRIAIARAAVRQAPILLLDEPSTGLDEENEKSVMDALHRLARDRTTILATHDLRRAVDADQILYFEGGHVLEKGSHAELMRAGGRYASVYQLQCAGDGKWSVGAG